MAFQSQGKDATVSFTKRPEKIEDIVLNILNMQLSYNLLKINPWSSNYSYQIAYIESTLNIDDLALPTNTALWKDPNYLEKRKPICEKWAEVKRLDRSPIQPAHELTRLNIEMFLSKGQLRAGFHDESDSDDIVDLASTPRVELCDECSKKFRQAQRLP